MFEPSPQLASLLKTVALQNSDSKHWQALMQRQSEFASLLQAQLTATALDPASRQLAEQLLDSDWSDEARQQSALEFNGPDREVIIGSGFHAAVYAAVRVRNGHPRPLVLESSHRAGGTFAMTSRATFFLNSRNRPGLAGLAGDQRASLNYLPGAPIQAADLSMSEYQTNADMAFVIRLALAQSAEVVTSASVEAVTDTGDGVRIEIAGRPPVQGGRVIDARGLGVADQDVANGTTILTFAQFMQRMEGMWPLRGVRRVAVIGGGDSAKCVLESLLGIAPQPAMAAAGLDNVEAIDCYSQTLPTSCKQWRKRVRGRYLAIGSHLRPDRRGMRRLTVINQRARPVALPDVALVGGVAYDLVVVCTGYRENYIDGLAPGSVTQYAVAGAGTIARQYEFLPVFRVGPHARLPFTLQEREAGIADIRANEVAMFRTASKTAALAATLPAVTPR